MAYGTTLLTLVSMLKGEAGQSTLVSVGVDDLPAQHQLLRRTQAVLYQQNDWPHLRVMKRKALAAGQYHYDMPTGLDWDRIEDVNVIFGSDPQPVTRGISFPEYAAYDSEADERCDPVLKWDMRWTGSATQIEVWPIPASNDMTLWFRGLRPLRALISNDDVADLDDNLIALYAAAEILAKKDSKDGQLKLATAQAHLRALKGNLTGGSKPFSLKGGGQPARSGKATINITG